MKKITIDEFLYKLGKKPINLVEQGLITEDDVRELRKNDTATLTDKLSILPEYLSFSIKHPQFLKSFLLPQIMRLLGLSKNTEENLLQSRTVRNTNIKTNIVTALSPNSVFEIGTYLGWAAASFKFANPNAEIYTINPKETKGANNPLEEDLIGYFYRKKKLKVNQIWGDSTKFDFDTLPEIDVIYIDGNHKYEYALQDLINSSKKAKKAVILDDYIPQDKAKQMNITYGPWNDGVVRAVDKFLIENPGIFTEIYSIENSPYCVLIK